MYSLEWAWSTSQSVTDEIEMFNTIASADPTRYGQSEEIGELSVEGKEAAEIIEMMAERVQTIEPVQPYKIISLSG